MQGMLREPIQGDQDRLLGHTPLLHTVEYPVEVRVGDVMRILHEGRPTIGENAIFVLHGRIWGNPGDGRMRVD